METTHAITRGDARALDGVADASVDLVVTSPPYPMIAMWDEVFTQLDPAVGAALAAGAGAAAFEAMHRQLDRVWAACWRVLKPGGILCVNIGDATRTIDGDFRLYANHARILTAAERLGFSPLPDILWRKPTNAPNKFMGSGMYPPGAYVTYEHEYVLIFRRGSRRRFTRAGAVRRRESAYFWEERNVWFSDLWTGLTGAKQPLGGVDGATRKRSAAFPLVLPWRLVQMFSIYGDTVLDPFLGTGTTCLAAAVAGRSSLGVELDGGLEESIRATMGQAVAVGSGLSRRRLKDHRAFVAGRQADGKVIKHHNAAHDTPVVTRQEIALRLWAPEAITEVAPLRFEVACRPL